MKPKIDESASKERLFSLFPEMPEHFRNTIRSHTSIVAVPKGHFIYNENERPKGFVCLLEGNAKVVKIGINGRGQIIRMVRPMGILGYRALFAEENYRSAAVTLEDSVIAVIEKEVLFQVLQENAALSMHIIKLIARELGQSNIRTLNLTQKYIRGRLADALLFLEETYGCNGEGMIGIQLSREDLAQLSSMTTSNAIRTLSAFASEGIVALSGKKIRICDMEALRKISELG